MDLDIFTPHTITVNIKTYLLLLRVLQTYQTNLPIIRIAILIALLFWAANTQAGQNDTVRVATFEYYPALFTNSDGETTGFFADLLKEIAQKEQLHLEFIPGTWDDGIKRMKSGKVDLITSAAYTKERDKYMDYPENPILVVWSHVYARQNSGIESILDLEQKRIGLMKNDFNAQAFIEHIESFEISCEYIYYPDFESIMNATESGILDAGVINNTVGAALAKNYNIKETGIVFNPFPIYFVAQEGNDELIAIIDKYIKKWKADEGSVYYQGLRSWLRRDIDVQHRIPQSFIIVGSVVLVITGLLLLASFLLRRMVRMRTLELKKTNTILAEKEESYRTTLNSIGEAVIATDMNHRIIRMNPEAEKYSKYTKDQSLGKKIEEVLNYINEDEIKASFSDLTSGSEGQEVKFITKNKQEYIISENKSPIKDDKGNHTGEVIVFRNITEEVKIREDIKQSEQRFKSLFNGINEPVFVYSRSKGVFTEVNQAACKRYGYSKEDMLKLCPEDILYKEKSHVQTLRDSKEKLLKRGKVVFESVHKTKHGRKFPVEIYSALFEIFGETHILSFAVDISERKESEEKLKKLNKELETKNREYLRLNRELKASNLAIFKAKEKAEESERLKSAFLANMSHEIRTPMNGILGFTDLLKNPTLNSEQINAYVEIIHRSGNRMLNTVNAIIEISKIETNQVRILLSELNLNDQMNYFYDFFLPEAKKKGLKLNKNTPPENKAGFINTDKSKFNSIFTNLIKNALKFTSEGEIVFGYKKKENENGSFFEFFVKDTGIGIPENRKSAIFERFIQADIEDKDVYEGSGLGLSIVKAYVEMLGGNIWVDTEEGQGSAFYFTLADNRGNITTTPEVSDISTVRIKENSLKIMIAEDDDVSFEYLKEMCEPFSKEIIRTTTGKATIEQCSQHTDTDLLLLDIKMPNMNGYEACREIRRFNKNIVIIAQTAYAMLNDKEKSLDAGCDAYIAKPVEEHALKELISQLTGK